MLGYAFGETPQGAFGGYGSRRNLDSEYYDLLGIERGASAQDIKRAFRRAAMKNHPDKGGDPERFKAVGEAYEVLSDPQRRQLYDRFGKAGVEGGAGSPFGQADAFSAQDILSQLFGMRPQRPQGPRDLVFELQVSLEDLYAGSTIPLNLRVPGQSARTLEAGIPKGAVDMQRVVMAGEAHDGAADLILVLLELQHSRFTRRNADLLLKVSLSLSEALCGWRTTVTTLDGRKLQVSGPPGDVVGEGSVRIINGEGMPILGDGDPSPGGRRHGRLFLVFSVRFPRRLRLDEKNRRILRQLLQGKSPSQQPSAIEAPEEDAAQVGPEPEEAQPEADEGGDAVVATPGTLGNFGAAGLAEAEDALRSGDRRGNPFGGRGSFDFGQGGGGAWFFNM